MAIMMATMAILPDEDFYDYTPDDGFFGYLPNDDSYNFHEKNGIYY